MLNRRTIWPPLAAVNKHKLVSLIVDQTLRAMRVGYSAGERCKIFHSAQVDEFLIENPSAARTE